ncbi:unnamed protein product [Caenorhabditis auriculariae]|uniref:Calx-beta domain-containing protein n=1 Tax=Caenorhabditis auriculariae TaxID=2777116 RepID=A0A8S1HQU3_9PELO|nr:unnamed protein product [Caenorhabditis auriculariae]
MSSDKGYIESAIDKTKELASDASDKIADAYHSVVGEPRAEDKARDNVKEGIDKAADKTAELRDKAGDKLRAGARLAKAAPGRAYEMVGGREGDGPALAQACRMEMNSKTFHTSLGNITWTVGEHCKKGLIVPLLSISFQSALLYFIGLVYGFLGITLAVDVFMRSIERITRATIRGNKRSRNGDLLETEEQQRYERVRVWNPAVANLTVMAVGSSAPEIMLNIAETFERGFHQGELGPATIVGTAAFNLFCVTAICVLVAPSPEAKKIVIYRVFIATAVFSTFAYVWLFIVLNVFSPEVVEIWEAYATVFYFFFLLLIAYTVDVQLWKCRRCKDHLSLTDYEATTVKEATLRDKIERWADKNNVDIAKKELYDSVEEMPVKPINGLAKHINNAYPNLSVDDQAKVLAYHLHKGVTKDRMYYRRKAVGRISSAVNKREEEREAEKIIKKHEKNAHGKSHFEFSARVYVILPQSRQVKLKILRIGDVDKSVTVGFTTVNGSLRRFGKDDIDRSSGKMLLGAKAMFFYVYLKLKDPGTEAHTKLGPCSVAQVRVPIEGPLVGSRGSFVEFVEANYVVKENVGYARLYVTRGGTRKAGNLRVFYETGDITATENADYEPLPDAVLEFNSQEYEKYIDVRIIDDDRDERDERVEVGIRRSSSVTIVSDDSFVRNVANIHKLLPYYLNRMKHGEETWLEQIVNAASVNSGDVANASFSDCVRHAIAFPWKFLIALIPPPTFLGGFPSFLISLALICFLTAAVGEMASIFGCMIGLNSTVTAITLVTVGMSFPDALASKYAAKHDENADDAIGHITGANCANVFLGIGIPWTMSALHWAKEGKPFVVASGDLDFSMSVFLICAFLFYMILVLRRKGTTFGCGELGGPDCPKIMSGLYFLFLWIAYVFVSIWNIHMPSGEPGQKRFSSQEP